MSLPGFWRGADADGAGSQAPTGPAAGGRVDLGAIAQGVRSFAREFAAEDSVLRPPGRTPRAARIGARVVLCGVLVGYGLLAHRLYTLQVAEHPRWAEVARRQHVRLRAEPAERGRLLLQDQDRLAPAAVSLSRGSLLVEGRPDRDPAKVLAILEAAVKDEAPLAPAERTWVEDRLRRGVAFYFRRRRLGPDAIDRLRRARLAHAAIEVEPVRAYPFGPLASQVLGLVGVEGKGASALEAFLDEPLTGEPGLREVNVDNLRRERVVPGALTRPARPGLDAVLTIDRGIQAAAEAELRTVVAEHQPLGAAAVVVDVATGDVLALASWPTYDPGDLRGDFSAGLRCRAITDTYEPGSTIKPLFVATAWELGLGGPDRPISCPKSLKVPNRRKAIEDHHLVGDVFEADVLVQSSNSGAFKITERLSPAQRVRVGEAFGLGRPTGLVLAGEAPGSAAALARTDATTLGSFAQGYAVSVTPLQMAMAYAALANGGTRFRPRLVKELVAPGGAVVRSWAPEAVARPLSGPVVVGPLRDALERVVSDPKGTARRARSERYRIAGKTGTTKLLVNGHYHEREVVASFCGFAPAEAPRIAFSVVVWGPSTAKEKKWGGTVAAPAAGRIAEQSLVLLRVPPSPPVTPTQVAQDR